MEIKNNNFVMIPNKAVQNLDSGEIEKPSFIQLYGKRTISYLRNLLKLENRDKEINFSIDMILWMQKEKGRLDHEKTLLKNFFKKLQIKSDNNKSIIEFVDDVDFKKSSNFMTAELDIYDYKKKDGTDELPKKIINFFMLMDTEYKIIMSYEGKLDKYNLLNLFCNIKSRIHRNKDNFNMMDREYEIAYPSYERIEKDIFIESDKTLKEYIDALVELDLIRYDYAGDMKMKVGNQTHRRKSNFTYVLHSNVNWEVDLKESMEAHRKKKRSEGWSFISKQDEISADEKRSITQKIHALENIEKKNKLLTQSQEKELAKLKRLEEKFRPKYTEDNAKELEEKKLLEENPDKELWEIYYEKELVKKALRAKREAYPEWKGDENDLNEEYEDKYESDNSEPDFEDEDEDPVKSFDEKDLEAHYHEKNVNSDLTPEVVTNIIQSEQMEWHGDTIKTIIQKRVASINDF